MFPGFKSFNSKEEINDLQNRSNTALKEITQKVDAKLAEMKDYVDSRTRH